MTAPSRAGRFTIKTADGLELAAEQHGDPSGPEILLVHGLGQSRISWSRQTQGSLARTCRVVSYDLRGHGDSSKPASRHAYEDTELWASDLQAVIDAAGLERPTIVGWSLGVLVVGHYVQRYGAERIGGLNAVGAVTTLASDMQGPVPIAFREPLASLDLATRCDAIAGFLAACFAVPPPETDLRRMLVFNGMVPREMQQGVVAMGNELPDHIWSAIPRLLATWGDEDQHVRCEMSSRLVELSRAGRLSVFEGAAHAPFYERPGRFNRELAAFAAR
jgi:non-heme chloroperoxidase